MSRFDVAHTAFETAVSLSPQSPEILAGIGYCSARAGNQDRAKSVLSELLALSHTRYVSSALVAQMFAALGEVSVALDWLDRAVDEHAAEIAWPGVRPVFDSLRSEDRFAALCAKVGVSRDARLVFS